MIRLELSQQLNEFLIYDSVCDRYTFSKLDETLKINTYVPVTQNYMLCMKYNSLDVPILRLFVNGKIYDNNLCKTKTGSLDYIISINYKNGPYTFTEGMNLIEIKCSGRFPEVYELYLEKYEPIPQTIVPFKPSDFIVLKNYNVYGGFYWGLNNVIITLMICDIYKKIPVICFDTGFYLNNNDIESSFIKYCNNWFSYYFEDPFNIPSGIYNYLTTTNKKVPIIPRNIKNENPSYSYFFNRNSFVAYNNIEKHKETCQKYLKLHPNVENYVNQIKNQIFTQTEENIKYIGIHYRGTDKIAEQENKEEYPQHYEYRKVYNAICKKQRTLENDGFSVYIVITTDELPFVRFMKNKLGYKVLYYKDALRSEISTSGMEENFENIIPRNKKLDLNLLNESDKRKYEMRDNLINSSVHIGYKDVSNYRKGLDCIVDAKLLDRCDIIYRSKGNFSLFCTYFNTNPNLKVIDLNDYFISNGKLEDD
jgi:hypothetical protein